MEQPNDSLKVLAKGAIIILTLSVLTKILNYVYKIIVARSLGPEGYGVIILTSGIIGFCASLAVFNLSSGVERYLSYYREKEGRIKSVTIFSIRFVMITGVLMYILILLFYKYVSLEIFKNPLLLKTLPIFALAIPFYVLLEIVLAAFRGFETQVFYGIFGEFGKSFIKLVITSVFLLLGLGITGISWAYPLTFFVLFSFGFLVLTNKVFNIFNKKIKEENMTKELLKYSYPLFFAGTLWIVSSWIDSFMIGYFKPEADIGIYNVAFSTSSLMTIFFVALGSFFIPVVSNLFSKEKIDEIKEIYSRTCKWNLIIGSIIIGFLIIFSQYIINILFGIDYSNGKIPLIILCIGFFVMIATGYSEQLLMAVGKTKLTFFARLISLISNVTLNIILIPKYGIIGAAVATSASFIVLHASLLIMINKFLSINPFNTGYYKTLVSLGTASLASFGIYHFVKPGFYTMLISFFVFSALMISLIIILKVLDKEDFYILKAILRKVGIKIL